MPKGCQFNQGQLPMSDVQAKVSHLDIIFHDDDETPTEFVIELLHSVFKKQVADAIRLTEAVDANGRASCGIYPRDTAIEMLEAALQRIRISGHPLLITGETAAKGDDMFDSRCKFCGAHSSTNVASLQGMPA